MTNILINTRNMHKFVRNAAILRGRQGAAMPICRNEQRVASERTLPPSANHPAGHPPPDPVGRGRRPTRAHQGPNTVVARHCNFASRRRPDPSQACPVMLASRAHRQPQPSCLCVKGSVRPWPPRHANLTAAAWGQLRATCALPRCQDRHPESPRRRSKSGPPRYFRYCPPPTDRLAIGLSRGDTGSISSCSNDPGSAFSIR
jgi:hypothetical protein